jgi:hypothetical protein
MVKPTFVLILITILFLGYEIPQLSGSQQGSLDWGTFRSDECKMNINYPTNFTVEKNLNEYESTDDFTILSDNPYIRVIFDCNNLDESSSINNYSEDISKIQEKLLGYDDFMMEDNNTTKWKVDGSNALSFIYASGEGAHTGTVTTNEVIYIPHNNGTITIRFISLFSDFDSLQTQELEKEMINSIKFLID